MTRLCRRFPACRKGIQASHPADSTVTKKYHPPRVNQFPVPPMVGRGSTCAIAITYHRPSMPSRRTTGRR